MITVEEALDRILSHVQPLGSEKVSLLEALGRVIAEDIYAPRDIPPYDNSGMDGYAVKYEDIQNISPNHPVDWRLSEIFQQVLFPQRRSRKDRPSEL